MNKNEIYLLLNQLDGSGSDNEYEATQALKDLGDQFPDLLLEKYRTSRKWKERSACVHYSTIYARKSEGAFVLGLEALWDKSKHVRHLACLLLSWSLREDALDELRKIEKSCVDNEFLKDIQATIDAIENQNSNYFVDRDHSGKVTLNII